jgi:uncharacterized protein (TIGR00369 family)
MTTSPLDCATLDRWIADSPGNRWLGLQAQSFSGDTLQLRLPWRDEFAAADDGAHIDASVLAMAFNSACGYLIVAMTGSGGAITDLAVDMLQTAAAGEFSIVSRGLRLGRQLSSIEAELRDAQQRVIAVARCCYLMPAAF